MTTFLDYAVELLVDPDEEARTRTADRIHVGFNYGHARSLVFLSDQRQGSVYDPATHTLISTHVLECGGEYPIHLHTGDREQILHAHDVLRDWFNTSNSAEDMPTEVSDEILTHLAGLDHYLAEGSWQIELARYGFPPRCFGAFATPNDATTAITSGKAWELAGIDLATDPYGDDLSTRDMTVIPIPIGVGTATR